MIDPRNFRTSLSIGVVVGLMAFLCGPRLLVGVWNNLGFVALQRAGQDLSPQSLLRSRSLSANDVKNLEEVSRCLGSSVAIAISVSSTYGLGISDLIQGGYVEATQRLRTIGSQRPDLASLYLGYALYQQGETQEALAAWRARPDISMGLRQQAHSLLNQGLVDDAISLFAWITEIKPDSVQAWLDLTEGYANKSDWQHIDEVNKKALALEPDNLNLRIMQAQVALLLYKDAVTARHLMDGLLPSLEVIDSLEDEFRLYSSYVFMAQLAQAQAQLDEAIDWQKRAMALPRVGDRWAMSAVASLYERKGDWEQASAWMNRAIAEAPNDASMYARQGHLLWVQGNLEHARRAFETSLALSPDVIQTHNDFAALLFQMQDWRSAADEYHKVLAIDSKNKVAQDGLMRLESGK